MCDPFPNRDVVFDLAPHAFDIMNFILDEWPERITCAGKAHRRPKLEESAFITAEFPSGAIGHVEASWLLPGKVRTVDIVGSERAAHINALTQETTVHHGEDHWDANVRQNNTIRSELEAFVGSCKSGKNGTNSGLVGAKVVRCVEASVFSMRNHEVVELLW